MQSDDADNVRETLDTLASEESANLPEFCQKRRLIEELKAGVLHQVQKSEISPPDAAYYFREAIRWLDELQFSTNPLVGSPEAPDSTRLKAALSKESSDIANHPEQYVWVHRDVVRAVTSAKATDALWRVDMDGVSRCAQTYLNARWACVPNIERLMVEALAFAEIHAYSISVKGFWGVFPPAIRHIWISAKSLVWIAVILYVANGATEQLGLWAGILSAVTMYFVIGRPQTSLTGIVANAKLLAEMYSVYAILGHNPACPSLIRERVIATSNLGAVWPAGMPNLVERAFRRNPESWQ